MSVSGWSIARRVALVAVTSLLAACPAALAAGTVTVSIQGQGSATGDGINCTQTGGPDCSEAYANVPVEECFPTQPGKPDNCVTFHESPTVDFTAGGDSNGFVYDGWTGCDSTTARVCHLTVDESTTVSARFRDAQAPSVSAPSPGSGVQRGTITLSATAGDNAGLKRVEFRVSGTLVGSATSAPYSVSWNTASVADGVKSLTATAVDTSDQVTTSGASSITVDNTAPTLSVTGGPSGQTFGPGTTQTWTFIAADTTSGLAAVECSVVVAGAPASFGACSGGSASHAVTNRPGGSYTFAVRARDAGGLVTTATARDFSIDTTPPETTVTSGPTDGSSSADTSATFGFGASEAGSTFECRVYPAALTPPAFGSCSAAATHTATGFSPGAYSFEVRARDAVGNIDATPAKRTFTVTAPSMETGSGSGTGTGTGTETGTGTGTETGTGTRTGTGPNTVAPFDPRITSLFFYKGTNTRFTRLVVTDLPKGAKVNASCKGRGCAFKRKSLRPAGAKLNVLKKLKRIRLRSGAVLQLKITSPSGELKLATWKIRTGKAPAISYRCAPKGGKLARCA